MDRLCRAQGRGPDIAVGLLDLEVEEGGTRTGGEDLSRVDVSGCRRECQDRGDAGLAKTNPREARRVAPETAERLLDLWADVSSSVRNQTTCEIFETWFSETALLEQGDGGMVIGVPSDRHEHMLGDRMRPLVERAFKSKGCEVGELVFEVYDQGGEAWTSWPS
jgi:hypothetical protein